jgi:nucleoside-diphosphate-sugar epimerase
MTRILVTGGSGYIGQHLVSALVASGRQVRVLDLRAPTRPLPDVQYLKGSVLDTVVVDDARPRASLALHGSCTARRNPFFSPHRPRKMPLRKRAR